jgi:serine protease Do
MSFTIGRGATMRRWTLGLTLLAAVAAPAGAAQTPARAGTARLRCVNCDPADSLVQRQKSVTLKLDSLRDVLMHKRLSDVEREILSREITLTLRALQEAFGERAAFVAATEPARRAFAESQAASVQAYGIAVRANPNRGYLGVSFEGVNYEYNTDTDHIIRFYQYPKIALVEPASPAERAGIVAGDTLLALNDMDVVDAGEMSLTRLLVPDRRLNVLVKRNGDNRRLAVIVGRPPAYFVRRTAPLPSDAERVTILESEPTARGRITVGARGAGGAVSVFQYSEADGLGGAGMENVTEGLGRALRVSSGVLVTRVPVGTPAYESGLRDGDVIRRAAGESVSSIGELRSILRKSNGEGVRIEIVRDRRNRELTLRW